jgi:hypothetical protein
MQRGLFFQCFFLFLFLALMVEALLECMCGQRRDFSDVESPTRTRVSPSTALVNQPITMSKLAGLFFNHYNSFLLEKTSAWVAEMPCLLLHAANTYCIKSALDMLLSKFP